MVVVAGNILYKLWHEYLSMCVSRVSLTIMAKESQFLLSGFQFKEVEVLELGKLP